jgi:p-hydroxybenzoate 3-monooxygenase
LPGSGACLSSGAMRTQVAIVGAGPAGMFLGHLLAQAGIEAVIIERHSRDYVEGRVRAGVLEPVTVALMDRLGLGARLHREGLVHGGTNIAVDGAVFHIDMRELTGGAAITVYGQSEVMKDLNDAAAPRDLQVIYEAEDAALHALESERPFVTWHERGEKKRIDCDFVAGCDGFHGISRASLPASVLRLYERVYPLGWLGVLAEAPPCAEELIYASHERGFALASMRSPHLSRYYIQCAADEDIEKWPDGRFWDELCLRLGPGAAARVTRGPCLDKTVAPLRSFVAEPMRHGRLFLAGDAAHIVPPAGAKGLNLAVSDVIYLSGALISFYETHSTAALDSYSARALGRVWKAERFSWWFTRLTHRFPDCDAFDRRMQLAELDYIRSSVPAQTSFAENYVGLPLNWPIPNERGMS